MKINIIFQSIEKPVARALSIFKKVTGSTLVVNVIIQTFTPKYELAR